MTVQTHTLANGFRIVTEAMPGLQSASVGIWVNAGGRHEARHENGIAHFLEHMAFKGTARRTALQIAEEIEDVGGYINAYTSREVTAYYARVLGADVPLAMDVIADILRNPVFDPNEIEVERGVILQEIGQSLDTPDDVIFDWLQEVAYPEQPLGRSILGPAERVKGFQRADLSRFVGDHYTPGQMILSAAGDVDHDAIVRLAETLFGDMRTQTRSQQVAAQFVQGARIENKGLEQVHFTFALPAPSYTDPGIYAAQIFASALGGGMSSRLFQEIREKRGLCYSIFAQAGSYADTGMMTLYAGTSSQDIGELARLTMEELARAAEDMSEAEVARARAQFKAGMLMGLESPTARAERMARTLSIWDRVPDVAEVVARVDSVGLDDVKAYGRTLCNGAPGAMAIYGPVAGHEDLTLDHLMSRLAA